MKITAVLMVKNVIELHVPIIIEKCLFKFDEVLVVDTGSVDGSHEILKEIQNITYHHYPTMDISFFGFAAARNMIAEMAKHDYIFMIDADEFVHPNIYDDFQKLKINSNHGCYLPRYNKVNPSEYVLEAYPDYQSRFYNRKYSKYSNMISENLNCTRYFISNFHLHHTNLYCTSPRLKYQKYLLYNYFDKKTLESKQAYENHDYNKPKIIKELPKQWTLVPIKDSREIEVVYIEQSIDILND